MTVWSKALLLLARKSLSLLFSLPHYSNTWRWVLGGRSLFAQLEIDIADDRPRKKRSGAKGASGVPEEVMRMVSRKTAGGHRLCQRANVKIVSTNIYIYLLMVVRYRGI